MISKGGKVIFFSFPTSSSRMVIQACSIGISSSHLESHIRHVVQPRKVFVCLWSSFSLPARYSLMKNHFPLGAWDSQPLP
ncbi:hypothetical protein SDC9_209312 [bioreactor metagenome]|uniref:Uncharacterized protein n=1 Tax=bioreactor metagenome TaxID=1076179 RepID=A0A645JMM2_9ZZZZ